MKIWCDVCDKEEATLFCSADEAALCEGCDRKVHHANKLASKHTRSSLLKPKLQRIPSVKLSSSSSSSSNPITSSSSTGYGANIDSENKSSHSSKRFRSVSNDEIFSSTSTEKRPLPSTIYRAEDNCTSDSTASISTSSISEYLMETLPGWRVDDFLEPSSAATGFCKVYNTTSRIIMRRL
ncbi:hypothetical protein PTKIN_Ptkin02bG0200000 [Pterospermum kingtungense]